MRRPLLVAVAGADALVLALGSFVAYGAHVTHPVTVAGALADFRDRPAFAAPTDRAPAGTPGARPEPGVYTYRTTGQATVDRPPVIRRYPAHTVRVVRHGAGCHWQEQVPLFREHVEHYDACAAGGDQADTGFGTRLVYFAVPAVTAFRCDPAGTRTAAALPPGGRREFRCTDPDHDVVARGTVEYAGERTVTIGGGAVRCRAVIVTTLLTGSNAGGARRELCTEPRTGLVVTERRTASVVAGSLVGRVRYTEQAEFVLESLRPRS